jgi:hypothetical protein
MSKSVSSGPLPYDPSFNTDSKDTDTAVAPSPQKKAAGPLPYDPSFNSGLPDKKKEPTPSPSSDGQSPSISTKLVVEPKAPLDKAVANWNSKDLTPEDVATMAQTDQGKQMGLNNLTKEGMKRYAQAHNVGTQQDLVKSAQDLTKQWTPLLKQDNQTPLSLKLKPNNPDNDLDALTKGVSVGDPDSIYAFKNKVLANLQKQQDQINDRIKSGTFEVAGGAVVPKDKAQTDQDRAALKSLETQMDNVKSVYDDYAAQSLVNLATKMPGGVHEGTNLLWVGRNLRRLGQSPEDFKAQQNFHDPNAITERNYLDEKTGYDATINALAKQQSQDYLNAVHTRSPELKTAADLRGAELNNLIDKRNALSTKYLPVDVYNASRFIGDKMAEINSSDYAPERPALAVYHTKGEVQYAIDQIQKDNPDFYKTHENAIKFILAHPQEVPLQGFAGGVQRGFAPPAWIERKLTGKTRAEEEMNQQFEATETGTSYAGKTPDKVVLDSNGKQFVEKQNESYGDANFNSVVGNMGEFSGNMVVYGLLTEGAGLAAGGAVRGMSAIADAAKLAKPFSLATKAQQTAGVIGSTYFLNYDNNAKIANILIDDDSEHGDFKKALVTNLMTLGQAAAMSILPANQFLKNNFTRGMGNDALETLASKNAGGLTRETTSEFLEKVRARALSVLQEAKAQGLQVGKVNAEMLLINHSNALLESMFDEKGGAKKNNLLQEDINTIRDVTLGSLLFGLPRLAKSAFPMHYTDAIYDAALHADENIARIQQMQDQGLIDREKANGMIKLINTAKLHLPGILNARTGNEAKPDDEGTGLPLSLKQKKKMLAEKVRADILTDQASKGPEDPEVKKAQSSAEKASQETKEEIPYIPLEDEKAENTEDAQGKGTPTESAQDQEVESEEEPVNLEPEDKITVREMLDKAGTYYGQEGQFYQDGQTVVFKVKDENREYELGNIDEIGDESTSSYGIDSKESVVKVDDKGEITVRDKRYVNNFSDPLSAINRDKEGNIVSVNLETEDGKKRSFRGDVAEDLAYQIQLKEIDKNNERPAVEDFINSDEPTREEVNNGQPSEVAPEAGSENPDEVQRSKIEKVVSSQPKINENGKKTRNEKEGSQAQKGKEGREGQRLEGEKDGNGERRPGQAQDVTEKGPAEAGTEEVGPSQLAQETKENHLEVIDNLEKREAKKKLSDKDAKKLETLRDKVGLIDKFGVDDIIKHLKDSKQIEVRCP